MNRPSLITWMLVVVATAFLTITVASPASSSSRQADARAAVLRFFHSIETRQFDQTCKLLSAQFFRRNRIRHKNVCEISLRISFMWAPSYRFAIGPIRMSGDRALVAARVNGLPGRLELIREGGVFKVLDVRGA